MKENETERERVRDREIQSCTERTSMRWQESKRQEEREKETGREREKVNESSFNFIQKHDRVLIQVPVRTCMMNESDLFKETEKRSDKGRERKK